jgi:hypothetical protein
MLAKVQCTSEALWGCQSAFVFKEVYGNEKPILLVDGIPIVSRHLDVHLTICARLRGYSFGYP